MKLNCKQNDLAIIVRTNGDSILLPHLGKILKLVGPVEAASDYRATSGLPCWRYEGPYLVDKVSGRNIARVCDVCLKPLDAPLDGEDLYLDVPTESEFLADNPEFRDVPYARPISDILSDFREIS